MLNGRQHGHEQNGSHRGSSAAYPSSASESTAVAIEWSDTDQCCDLLVGKHAELRKVRQQGIDDLCADTGYGEQDIALVAPLVDLFDQLGDLPVKFFDLGLDVAYVTTDVGGQESGHDVEAIFLHGADLDELASTSGHILDLSDISERYGTNFRAHHGSIFGQHPGIDLICFGQDAGGTRIAPDLDRLADDNRQFSFSGGHYKHILSAPGGLDNDPFDGIAREATDNVSDTRWIIGGAEMERTFMDDHIQLSFADIDADVDGFLFTLRHCSKTSPLLNSGSWAHSTVRDK